MPLPFSAPDPTPDSPLSQTTRPAVVTAQLHALSAGHFSLPEHQFVHPASPTARKTVPSLCFLVQHTSATTGKQTRIVFDLGLRRDPNRYAEPIRRHVATRQPMTTVPDVVASLAAGGLSPDDVDYVLYSHVHWDHIGQPSDFPRSTFIVGHGSLGVLAGTATLRGGHSFFEADLLEPERTVELPDPVKNGEGGTMRDDPTSESPNLSGPWEVIDGSPPVLDIFRDGSVYVVDAPGHLPGHVNLLVRVEDDGKGGSGWVYLAGDACHDRRILRGEKEIGEWHDAAGHVCCIHADRPTAEATIERIRKLEENGVEVIFAHDVEWETDEGNKGRFFGAMS